MTPLLRVEDLAVRFPAAPGGAEARVLRGASFSVRRGEIVGLVGESGAGKTLAALAVLGLVPPPGRITAGSIRLAGEELVGLSPRDMAAVRGRRVAMVFQEPTAALNPVFTIGFQIVEAVRRGGAVGRREARRRAVELLQVVAMPDPAGRMNAYPHELSGGQCQRAMIAMALAGEPELLLADEPTTALDVTVQAQILGLLDRLRRELALSILLITHDLGVVAQTADRVVTLYAGEVVEEAPVGAFFRRPAHPYARALLAASPGRPGEGEEALDEAIPGAVPEPTDLPSGCAFHPRCPEVMERCRREAPGLYPPFPGEPAAPERLARCFLHDPAGEASR